MANIIKKPYEISLWDEILVFRVNCRDANGESLGIIEKEKSLEDFEPIEGTKTTEVIQYYKERKIAIIGSDTMDTPIRAINSKLVSNVNGSNTLTFSMYSKYWDEDAEQFFDNPFLKLLVNERKVKVRYGAINNCKWYDLIIKNVQENSENKTFTYTAKDQFVNELSKSGFNLVLDAELENNMGNITTLAETILEESDWKLGENNSLLRQYKEEPLYEIVLNTDLEVINMLDENEKITISKGEIIYGFYGLITNKENHFQLLYNKEGYEVDDNYVITNSKVWFLENITYNEEKPVFAKSMTISKDYRGKRFVRQIQTKYDATIDKYVQVYEQGKTTYYGYTEMEYVSPTAVQNFITQPNGFSNYEGGISGWEVGGITTGNGTIYPTLELQGYPDIRDISIEDIDSTEFTSFLKYKATNTNQLLYNSGINDSRSLINGFADQEEFVFRIKYAKASALNNNNRPTNIIYQTSLPQVEIGIYELNEGVYTITDSYFSSAGVAVENIEDYVQVKLKCKKSLPYSKMIKAKIGLFLKFPKDNDFYIEDVQFFRYVTYEKEILDFNGEGTNTFETLMAVPGGELIASVRTKYYYYIPNEEYKEISDVVYVYEGYTPCLGVNEVYNDNQFEKIRSITAKESNRFNLIQTLCETFECWAKFEIEHNMTTGEILLDENDGYRQKKWITFHEYIGKDNYAGFRYGINLKSIQRTLDSNGVVSKMIVKNNANQFADNGFCSIARAQENPTGENFLLDFSYYIQQGLMGFSELNNDLYLDVNGYIGYYKKLHRLNLDREKWIEEQAGLLTDISEFQASYQTYKISVETAEEELRETEISIKNLTGWTYKKLLEEDKKGSEKAKNWLENVEVIKKINKLAQLKNTIARHTILRNKAEELLKEAENHYKELEDSLEDLTVVKRALNLQFYKKYSRFIQEGSWIKEDYIDDNLYYLDAESTLHTSARPKVSYSINVLELSQLEGYENYNFDLGDKTYIEDTEFFGWTWSKDGVKTPYHEEIVVTETVIVFDSPEQNTVKVQNYKTQFEDLFQRITATTQSIEYHTGEYGRAANVVETDGTIVADTLQNSIANNAIRLENAKDQSVVWDETGITTTSLSKPNEMVRIISGGVFMSVDGGVTWNTGVTGSGINATYITSGYLNTSVINIMNSDFPSFRWDGIGLNAFQFEVNQNTGEPYGFNIAKFVRFDQYGIYGINGQSEFDPNISQNGKVGEDKIWANANYALTWKGFMLKNEDGSVRITSTDDIQVLNGENERIKIGRIEDEVYGIRISNASGATVMKTDDSGELWLEDRLRVGTNDTSTVEIGYLKNVRQGTDIHEVIHAGDEKQEFIVYEDGKMFAQGAEFHGTIYATGGQIGNMTIDDVQGAVGDMNAVTEAVKKLDIQSKMGYNFKVEGDISTPTQLELTAMPIAITQKGNAKWFGSKDFNSWIELANNTNTFVLTYEAFKNLQLNKTYYIKAAVLDNEERTYEKWVTIMSISDGERGEKGEPGEQVIRAIIQSSAGDKFINNKISTTLTCHIFEGNTEIDLNGVDYDYKWQKYDKDGNKDETWQKLGKNIQVTSQDVSNKATFSCSISVAKR